jgi:mannitol-1-phosphate 5-dehydrogenase
MRVVIVGSGKIGCGYLAPLFTAAGWEVVLAARTRKTADRIRRAGRLQVRITSSGAPATLDGMPRPSSTIELMAVGAVAVDEENFVEAVSTADLVCTAVGVGKVPSLGPPLAAGLAARPRGRPLDVWVVENGDCAGVLEDAVHAAARERGLPLPQVGFAGSVAKVAVARGGWRTGEHPAFVGDAARELWVDPQPLRTRVPALPGVQTTRQYRIVLLDKLYVFNAGHAICAYLGWLRGHQSVAQAVADPYLRPMVVGAMLESRRALLRAHPSLGKDLYGPVGEALRRFGDSDLADPVSRVGRDPIRKLGPRDRLLGPVGLIREATGRIPDYFALAVAGALLFREDQDDQACCLRGMLSRLGVMDVLREVCGLAETDPFARAVAERYRGFVLTDDGWVFPPVHSPNGAHRPHSDLAEVWE